MLEGAVLAVAAEERAPWESALPHHERYPTAETGFRTLVVQFQPDNALA